VTGVLDELFAQHEWANLRLIEACRRLSDDQLDATADGVYGSIRQTLVHLVAAEPSYVTRIGGTYDGPTFARGTAPGFDLLEAMVRASARGLAERARAVDSAPFTFRSPEDEEIDASVVIAQALNHGADHRSQLCTILTTLGIEPPALDTWAWAEATGRAARASPRPRRTSSGVPGSRSRA